MDFIIKVVLAYLLGSVVGSLVVGRLRGGVDIRKLGSGNPGSTNALRTQGLAFGIWVIIIDVAKGWIAAALLPGLVIPGIPPASGAPAAWLTAACAFAAILGHVFPVWHGFRGGKGVATLVGAYAGLGPLLLLPLVVDLAGGGHGVGLCRPVIDRRRARHARLSTAAGRRPVHATAGVRAGLRGAGDLHASRQRAPHA